MIKVKPLIHYRGIASIMYPGLHEHTLHFRYGYDRIENNGQKHFIRMYPNDKYIVYRIMNPFPLNSIFESLEEAQAYVQQLWNEYVLSLIEVENEG